MRSLAHLLLAGVLVLTTFGQVIIKWRALKLSQEPSVVNYLFAMLTDLGVLSGLGAAGAAAVLWIWAIQRLELSYAYPLMALTFAIVPVASHLMLGESLRPLRLGGIAVIVFGVVLTAMDK